jgi:hypothetical protein
MRFLMLCNTFRIFLLSKQRVVLQFLASIRKVNHFLDHFVAITRYTCIQLLGMEFRRKSDQSSPSSSLSFWDGLGWFFWAFLSVAEKCFSSESKHLSGRSHTFWSVTNYNFCNHIVLVRLVCRNKV